jgi:hypothetical protein
MKTTINHKQCCRYTYAVFPGMNISLCLEINPWLFNKAFNIMAFHNNAVSIPKNIFKAERDWITDNLILFSGFNDDVRDYHGKLNWDDFGTWYIYLYPSELKTEGPLVIGKDSFLEKSKGMDFVDYHSLNKEWQCIHERQPDIFITRQKKGIMIGALSELNLYCIETAKH